MNEEKIGLILFCVTAVLVSVVSHYFIRHYKIASIVAALAAIILFLWAATIHAGHVDPFFPIAFVVGGAYAFGIALVVGIPFRNRRRIPPGRCQKCGYDLTGNESGTCPECGLEVEQA